jgi:hypothetical protein
MCMDRLARKNPRTASPQPLNIGLRYLEVENGRKNDWPQLAAALAHAQATGATLVIAKLDRLARNVAVISNLMEAGVDPTHPERYKQVTK